MDACDTVMDKMRTPRGLIRYASYNAIGEGKRNLVTPRVIGYSAVLTLLLVLLFYFILGRAPVETTILRVPGTLYQLQENGMISNLYNIQLINKTYQGIDLRLELDGSQPGVIRQVGIEGIHIGSNTSYQGVFFIELPANSLVRSKTTLTINVLDNEKVIEKVKTSFYSPQKRQ
jgi:polyferredoxin